MDQDSTRGLGVKKTSKCRGSNPVGLGGARNVTGWWGQEFFKTLGSDQVGSGRVRSGQVDPSGRLETDTAREKGSMKALVFLVDNAERVHTNAERASDIFFFFLRGTDLDITLRGKKPLSD